MNFYFSDKIVYTLCICLSQIGLFTSFLYAKTLIKALLSDLGTVGERGNYTFHNYIKLAHFVITSNSCYLIPGPRSTVKLQILKLRAGYRLYVQ